MKFKSKLLNPFPTLPDELHNDTIEILDDDQIYRTVFYQFLGPSFSILGIIGNICCLLAIWYHRHRIRSSNSNVQTSNDAGMGGRMYTYLIGLSIADLFYLAYTLQNYFFIMDLDILQKYQGYVYDISQPTWNAFKATSDFIVICMTIDRYRIMNNIVELRLQMLRDEDEKFWNIYLQIFGSFVISFILHTPQYFQINDSIILNNNVTSLDSVLIMEQMYVYIYIVLCKALPLILILVLNICLVRKLKTIWYRRRTIKNKNVTSSLNNLENSHVQNEQRRAAWSVTNTRSLREQKMAILLLIVAFIYIIFTLPANIMYVYFCLTGSHTGPWFAITNFLESVNYSLNFYVYILVHEEIRHSFLDLCKVIVNFTTCGYVFKTYSFEPPRS